MSVNGAAGDADSSIVDLTGSWTKSAGTEGELAYPDVLEMTMLVPGAGRYLGRKGRPEQGFLLWDAGNWRLTADGKIEISTATDALESWPVTISGDEMQIQVADCVLTYRRTNGPDD
ncbi:MAG: hypothetical protein ABI912_11240 [Actinomycetota bacterium]